MSRQKGATTFTSTSAKDYVRDIVDRGIIKGFKEEYYPEDDLAYLGLPGERLLDILSWRGLLGRYTAVQVADSSEAAEVADEIERNALLNHLEHGFQLVRANIDELLISPDHLVRLRWPYQVVNLDYYGGLVNLTDQRTSRRLQAIRSLFQKQEGVAFVLLLTLNLRDDDKDEMTDLVKIVEDDLLGIDLQGVSDCFAKHRELGHAGQLKIYLPIFLANEAKRHMLKFTPPILYQGTKEMVHFAVQCIPYTDLAAGRLFGTKERIDLINLPLLVLREECPLEKVQLGFIDSNGR